MYPKSFEKIFFYLNKLPGVGPKTAERFAMALLNFREDELADFAEHLKNLRVSVSTCPLCRNLSESGICRICKNSSRDQTLLCVVSEAREINAIEQTGSYNGLYHVLQGTLDTMRGITPDMLSIAHLLEKITNPATRPAEVILGLAPTMEGDATAQYLAQQLRQYGIPTTRLARGLPTGSDLEYADSQTIISAINGRTRV